MVGGLNLCDSVAGGRAVLLDRACPVLSRNQSLSRLNWTLLLGLSVRWAAGWSQEDGSLQETACGREMGWEALACVPWVLWAAPAPRTLLTCFQASGPAFRPLFHSSPRFYLSRSTPPLPWGLCACAGNAVILFSSHPQGTPRHRVGWLGLGKGCQGWVRNTPTPITLELRCPGRVSPGVNFQHRMQRPRQL